MAEGKSDGHRVAEVDSGQAAQGPVTQETAIQILMFCQSRMKSN